jgi:hypothetical protein
MPCPIVVTWTPRGLTLTAPAPTPRAAAVWERVALALAALEADS